MVNTTNSEAVITVDQQGNYSCVATSRHGTDKKEFPVIFTGKYGREYIYIYGKIQLVVYYQCCILIG